VCCCLRWLWVLLTLSDDANTNPNSFTDIALLGIATTAAALSPVKVAAFTGWTKLTLYLLLPFLHGTCSPCLRSWVITLYLHVALIVSVYGLQWFLVQKRCHLVDPESPIKVTRVYSYEATLTYWLGICCQQLSLSLMAFAWRGWVPKTLAVTMFVSMLPVWF